MQSFLTYVTYAFKFNAFMSRHVHRTTRSSAGRLCPRSTSTLAYI